MKVIFIEHVLHTGKPWEIKEVSSAYATNFLIPKWLAKKLTPEMEKSIKNKSRKQESQRREIIWDVHGIIQKLNGVTLNFSLPSRGEDKVFWSIGEKDIVGEIQKHFHIPLTKKHVVFPQGHIKKTGEDFVYVKLGTNASAKVNVLVTAK